MRTRHRSPRNYVKLDPPRINVQIRGPHTTSPPCQNVNSGSNNIRLQNLRSEMIGSTARKRSNLRRRRSTANHGPSKLNRSRRVLTQLYVLLDLIPCGCTHHSRSQKMSISEKLFAVFFSVGHDHSQPTSQLHCAAFFDSSIPSPIAHNDLPLNFGRFQRSHVTVSTSTIRRVNQRKLEIG
ncbi:hypothetical protein Fmac_010869 [Flemingia macrophylla]|uniref:Uncharacterized protein n=1 Tax=Flemingia macrophylla TaxID=520843 RepID=A0ABD1MLN5_9FABA